MTERIDIEKSKNSDTIKLMIAKMKHRMIEIEKGGGQKRIQKQHDKGKMTARERVDYLLDPGTQSFEVAGFAGYDMYKEHGGCPSGGVVVKIGYIRNRICIVVANDATVKAGAWFPITAKKNLRAQEIAIENRLPIVYLVDSAGVFLPMQDEIFPDKEHFGRMFRNNAKMSSLGIIQISAIMGACVAGGAYLPIMSDEALIVDKTGSIFLAGPYLVRAAIGEIVDKETLGGATTQSEISGVTDYKMPDDPTCLDTIKDLMDKIGHHQDAGINRIEPIAPIGKPDEILEIFPAASTKPYDTVEVLKTIVDNGDITQYKEGFGRTIICGYARIDGWSVGIVANNRKIIKTKSGEVQIGGVIYSDSADKAARFVMICNQKKIPLVFFQDVTGFMVGSRSEHGGIIKDGAKLVNAVSNSTVPKFTVIMGNSYGAGNYAMCGKAYDPRLIVAWPTAKVAVMGGAQAANTLLQIQVASLKRKGEEPDPDKQKELFDTIKNRYDQQTTPYYAAARLWVDAIIDPRDTRQVLSMGITAANQAPIEKFNVGVLQT